MQREKKNIFKEALSQKEMRQKYAERFPKYERPILESPANRLQISIKGLRGKEDYEQARKALESTIQAYPLSPIETLRLEDSRLIPEQYKRLQHQAKLHNQWLTFIAQDPCFRIQREGDKFVLYKTLEPVEIATQRFQEAQRHKHIKHNWTKSALVHKKSYKIL